MILLTVKNVINPQWFAGIGVTLLMLHLGLMSGWTSPTLSKLMSENSPLPLTPSQASWVVSLLNLSRFFGSIFGAMSVHYLGSKRSIFISLFPIASGWLVTALASTPEWLYVGRLLSGISLGMVFGCFPLYIGEVAMPRIRGALISLATLGVPLGQFISTICSTYLSMAAAGFIYFAFSLPLMVLFFWLPESPHHLVKEGNLEAAISSIQWYSPEKSVHEELDSIKKLINANAATSFGKKFNQLITPPVRSITIQIMILFAFTQFSGLNIIIFYMEMILRDAKFTLIDPSEVVIYVNFFCVLASGASIFLIDRCGRKFLLLISSVGICLSMVGLMCHFIFVHTKTINIEYFQWLPITAILLYMISFFLGLFPVPSAILGEVFPSHIKCTAACMAILVGAITAFISAKTYQPLLDLIGDVYLFMIYAIISIFMIPYTLFVVRETKGKSLQQIQDELVNS